MKELIHEWHSYLGMPKYSLDWHKNDIKDELEELKEAKADYLKEQENQQKIKELEEDEIKK